MAGFRSLLAHWVGGAGAEPPTQAGVRSLLARWIGGAGSQPATQAGARSLFAFWSGGATAVTPVTPEPQPQPSGGGWGGTRYVVPIPLPHAVRGRLRITLNARIGGIGHVEPIAVHGGALRITAQIGLSASGRVDNALPEQIAEEDELLLLI